MRRDGAVHQAGWGGHPDLGGDQVPGPVVAGAAGPQRAAVAVLAALALAAVILLSVFRFRREEHRARGLAGAQRPVGLQAAQRVRRAGAAEVPEAWVVVGEQRGCPGGREAAVQPGDVPLAGGLAEDWRGEDAEAGEESGDREGLGDVADHDGHPPLPFRRAGHVPVGEDVSQRALAGADHADKVQQAVDLQRQVLLEAVLPPDEELDPQQAVSPVALAVSRQLSLLLVHLPGGFLQLRPGHGQLLVAPRRPCVHVVGRRPRPRGQFRRERDREEAVPDREHVLPRPR